MAFYSTDSFLPLPHSIRLESDLSHFTLWNSFCDVYSRCAVPFSFTWNFFFYNAMKFIFILPFDLCIFHAPYLAGRSLDIRPSVNILTHSLLYFFHIIRLLICACNYYPFDSRVYSVPGRNKITYLFNLALRVRGGFGLARTRAVAASTMLLMTTAISGVSR